MHTSGLTLDFYDDPGCTQLKDIFPTTESLPECTKTAAVLSSDDRGQLPDDVFALVLHDGDVTLRKYACFDGGNTALSVGYFLANAHKLPEEAQKVAAANLVMASGWYELSVPEELQKIADGETVKLGGIMGFMGRRAAANPIGTAMTAVTLPSQVHGVGQEIGRNQQAMRHAQQMSGSSVVTPEEMHHAKFGEVVGSTDMPVSAPSGQPVPKTVAVVRKTGAAQKMDIYAAGREEKGKPETNEATKGKPPEKCPKCSPHVDVTGKTAGSLEVAQYVTRFALEGGYPLETYTQVKQASAYFNDYSEQFSPEQRREYCANLVKRASELAIELTPAIRKYGSAGYAPDDEIEMAIRMRRNVLTDDTAKGLLDKVAASRTEMPPLAFAEVLMEFDKVAGIDHLWDQHIYDPFFSTYGTTEKTAEEEYSSFVDTVGNARVTGDQLKDVAKTKHGTIKEMFGHDFCKEFCKDPISIYKSLPREQKLMVINMANDNAPGVRGSPE